MPFWRFPILQVCETMKLSCVSSLGWNTNWGGIAQCGCQKSLKLGGEEEETKTPISGERRTCVTMAAQWDPGPIEWFHKNWPMSYNLWKQYILIVSLIDISLGNKFSFWCEIEIFEKYVLKPKKIFICEYTSWLAPSFHHVLLISDHSVS